VIVISRWETALTEADHAALSELLTAAFPRHPGLFVGRSWAMARKEARLWIADDAGVPLAHLALERRLVGVAGADVLVAGVGEVAVAPHLHGRGLGVRLMEELRPRLRGEFAADFGLLWCREEVVPFYLRAGWARVGNPVRYLDPGDERTVYEGVRPTLIMAGRRPVEEWPDGLVDLRGLPW
jgi:GNAT superfamily N-acetyltransferase